MSGAHEAGGREGRDSPDVAQVQLPESSQAASGLSVRHLGASMGIESRHPSRSVQTDVSIPSRFATVRSAPTEPFTWLCKHDRTTSHHLALHLPDISLYIYIYTYISIISSIIMIIIIITILYIYSIMCRAVLPLQRETHPRVFPRRSELVAV